MTKDKSFRLPSFVLQQERSGITLLLVILVLSALLSTSLGIYNVVFTELRLSGEIADSFVALYAADEAIERGLFEDRDAAPFCLPAPGRIANCYDSGWVTVTSGACYRLRADKSGNPALTNVTLKATGEFRCAGGITAVKRALDTSYSVEE